MEKCRICGCKNIKEVWLYRSHPKDNDNSIKKYRYYFCEQCGCLQEDSFPSDYDAVYSDYFEGHRKFVVKDFLWNKGMRYSITGKGIFGKMISDLFFPEDYSFCQKIPKNSYICDIGCSDGTFLKYMEKNGYSNLIGCDPYLRVHDYCGKIKFFKEEADYFRGKRKFDCITLINVLEHIENQDTLFELLFEMLENKGKVYIILPVINDYLWNNFESSIWSLSPPEHICLYSKSGITYMAGKYGFVVKSFSTRASSILWDDYNNSQINKLHDNTNRNTLRTILCVAKTKKQINYMNKKDLGNMATVVLEKK